MIRNQFDLPSLGVFAAFSIILVLATLAVGNMLGRHSARQGDMNDTSIGSAVAAMLGLLAFMLAFTFNSAAERFSERKALLLNEVNAISTTYLRADLLPLGERKQARSLLAEYVALRNFDPKTMESERFINLLKRSDEIQQELWQIVATLSASGYEGVRLNKFVDSLNEVIDFHTSRFFVGTHYRIPMPIWGALFAVTALSMLAIGFQLGSGRRGSPQVAIALALSFSVVIMLIADLDRSYEGLLIMDHTPMAVLDTQLQAAEQKVH
ncbi:hypothetical protein [uncultured Microbulbifer sp.]|uniref:bestrophin-like domain n=1 Tax=uncultured Microbulbifer sp. TaxID=348147 RepID=UPI0025FC70BE|nr:hypothetical protein [uncultured Microbulbifer sp.]